MRASTGVAGVAGLAELPGEDAAVAPAEELSPSLAAIAGVATKRPSASMHVTKTLILSP